MNRGELKTRVGKMLGLAMGTDADSASEIALLEELANEAVVDVLMRTRVHVREAQVVLDAGATEWDIDDTILRIWGVRRSGADITTDVTLQYEGDRDTLASNEFDFPSFTRIILGMAGTGTDLLRLWYTPAPTKMTTDAHAPSTEIYGRIPPQFHIALINYMCWHAADKIGDSGSARGEKYRARYEGQNSMAGPGTDLGKIKVFTNTQGGAVRIPKPRRILRGDLTPRYWQG